MQVYLLPEIFDELYHILGIDEYVLFDPSAPHQKGACENNHELIRRILPKGTSFDNLTQADINLMMNHINSYTRENLNDKCPIEVFEKIYGIEILKALEVTRINPNDITLLPELLK